MRAAAEAKAILSIAGVTVGVAGAEVSYDGGVGSVRPVNGCSLTIAGMTVGVGRAERG